MTPLKNNISRRNATRRTTEPSCAPSGCGFRRPEQGAGKPSRLPIDAAAPAARRWTIAVYATRIGADQPGPIVARELGVIFQFPLHLRPGAGQGRETRRILTTGNRAYVLFIDEIHRLNPALRKSSIPRWGFTNSNW